MHGPPDPDDALAILRAVATPPTAPYHEQRVLAAIDTELTGLGLPSWTDGYGQVFTRVARGEARRALVLAAHTDHPAFEIVEADGAAGRARISGGLGGARGRQSAFARSVRAVVHHDDGRPPIRATLDDYVEDLDVANNSPGHVRVRAEGPLEAGQWAVLDLPALQVRGDELRMAAADDLAGCALIVAALARLRDEPRSFDVHAVFTRAEETGLFGARLIAEDAAGGGGMVPRDAYVVSVEASNAVYAPAGDGIVVRVGDLHNTFSNEAERYLRVAQERLALADPPVRTQRRLLAGGTCEASAFVRLG
ncbi:MAG: hypothetical protein ACRDF0_11515, partial [Candidatus Limnocylindria bacterium]